MAIINFNNTEGSDKKTIMTARSLIVTDLEMLHE